VANNPPAGRAITATPTGARSTETLARRAGRQRWIARHWLDVALVAPLFLDAFVNTLGITAIGVSLEMVIGLIIALMLARGFRGRGLFRSFVLIPLGVPTLVAGAAMLYFVGLSCSTWASSTSPSTGSRAAGAACSSSPWPTSGRPPRWSS
jgi:ABC-type sugar transport system permease subunit